MLISIKEAVLDFKSKGFILDEKTYVNASSKCTITDLEGYKFSDSLSKIRHGNHPKRIQKRNPYSFQNLKRWMVLNNCEFELIEGDLNFDSNSKLLCRCKKDGYEWNSNSTRILCGHGCPKCAGSLKLTLPFIVNKLKAINKNVIITSTKYVESHEKLDCMCKIDGNTWSTSWNKLSRGHGCPKCKGRKIGETRANTLEYVRKTLRDNNKNIEIVSNCYKNNDSNLKLVCSKDNHTWENTWRNIRHSGYTCPKCSMSKGELRVSNALSNLKLKYETQKSFADCKSKNNLRFDFYIHELKTCIEYDGLQHIQSVDFFGGEEGFKQTKLRDGIKNLYCKNNNLNLIRIPHYDYDRIDEILERELTIKL